MLIPIHQQFPHRALPDVSSAVAAELSAHNPLSALPAGSRVAIGVGSRGIANIRQIVQAVVDFCRSRELQPFLFPAMGSHGGGTPEGQLDVLAHYGITQASMGCPIVSSFDVLSLGRTERGIEVFVSRDAWQSDGVFLIGRVKWHTSFAGAIESGISKMMAIGLGKLAGATTCHAHARSMGLEAVIRSVGERVLSSGKLLGGLAIVEDAYHQTARVAVLPAAGLIEREEELLFEAKSFMPRIPVDQADILMIDEIGKNISGTGMDLKVVNRGIQGQYNPWPESARFERIFIRSLSDMSYGNAVGVGLADVVRDQLVDKIDVGAGLINAKTSGSLAAVRIPLHFPTDRECLDLLTSTVGKFDPAEVTIVWIRNTLDLSDLYVSENLLPQLQGYGKWEQSGDPFELRFGATGNLEPAPANCVFTKI